MPRSLKVRKLENAVGLGVIVALALASVLPLLHILYMVIVRGFEAIARIGLYRFLTEPPHPFDPQNPGGIGPALVGSLELSGLAIAVATLIALPASVLIAEFRGSRISRGTLLLALTLVEFPTILVGLTVYAVLVDHVIGGYNMLAGAVALTLVILPYMTVQASEALRGVPEGVREAAYSLGATRLKTVYTLIAPAARRGILVGILIGLARAAGETAPLLF
ncbi:MAG: ABC transporter permease subunit, partial [Desulfurococcales archaeon]|nr:ABC transporter permease subunit [Desulfurococcales archaeon]